MLVSLVCFLHTLTTRDTKVSEFSLNFSDLSFLCWCSAEAHFRHEGSHAHTLPAVVVPLSKAWLHSGSQQLLLAHLQLCWLAVVLLEQLYAGNGVRGWVMLTADAAYTLVQTVSKNAHSHALVRACIQCVHV